MAYLEWVRRRWRERVALWLGVPFLGCCGPAQEHTTSELIAPGEPEVQLGAHHEAGYQALGAGAPVPVIWGAQGGTWIMPVLRVRGIASPMEVAGRLVLEDGEVLGESQATLALAEREGWLESERFAVPVQHAPPHQFEAVDDVYGRSATVSVQAHDDQERFADCEVRVELTEP